MKLTLRHNSIALALAVIAFFAGTTYAASEKDSLSIAIDGFNSPVGMWLPAAVSKPAAQSKPAMQSKAAMIKPATQSKPAPSVYLWFHGGMTSGNCAKGLIAGADFAELHPKAIVMSTSACKTNHWWTATTAPIADAALDSLEKRIGATIKEVSLVGVSDGGMGIFAYSLYGKRSIKSRLFISANGSLLGPAAAIAKEPKLHTGKYRFLQGGADRLYSPAETIPWVESFCKAVQVDCELKYDPQGEHDWSYWKENRLDWVLHP